MMSREIFGGFRPRMPRPSPDAARARQRSLNLVLGQFRERDGRPRSTVEILDEALALSPTAFRRGTSPNSSSSNGRVLPRQQRNGGGNYGQSSSSSESLQ